MLSHQVFAVAGSAPKADLFLLLYQPVEGDSLSDVLKRFGQKLRRLREPKGNSQEKLAALAGLHRTYVSLVERGACNISLLNIEKLATALGVPLAKLMP